MIQRTDSAWPWVVDALVVLYSAWLAFSLSASIPAFKTLFSGLGADLPIATSFVMSACTPPLPYVAAVVLALALVLKNRLLAGGTVKLGISALVLIVLSAAHSFVHEALLRPLLHLIEVLK